MARLVLAMAVAALLCTLAYLGLAGIAAVEGEPGRGLLMVAGVTLFVSVLAVIFAAVALMRARALQAQLLSVTRAFDSAIRSLSEQRNRDVAPALQDESRPAAQVREQAGETVARGPLVLVNGLAPDQSSNVVPLPAAIRLKKAKPETPSTKEPGLDSALRRALAAGSFELGAQPIVSIAEGAPVGFEAYAHVQRDLEPALDLRRIAEAGSGAHAPALERLMLASALQAARRKLGGVCEARPLHVAVSEALLGAEAEVKAACELLAAEPALARSIVLSLPARLLERRGPHVGALQALLATGLRLAAEAMPTQEAQALSHWRIAFLKLPARRLLEKTRPGFASVGVAALMEQAEAAGMAIVATGVDTDEDAVGLIDLGVGLMTGRRFSGPRPLKGDDGTDRSHPPVPSFRDLAPKP